MKRVLVIGACGQIGTELVLSLREIYGAAQVVASDVKVYENNTFLGGPYKQLDVLDREAVRSYIIEEKFSQVYLLAALLSATAEKNPDFAWRLNMEGLFTILDLAKEGHIEQIFWPSSIAVFGPTTPKNNTPQYTVMEPSTVYGISKLAGERWCEYYFKQFDVDVRSIRYPGLISHTSLPGGGTTDYAVDIFYQAKKAGAYTSFLDKDSALPMMYMEDAIRATIELMQAPKNKVKIRSSYNLAGISFTPETLAAEIKKHLPDFTISYQPDFRQGIADSWPNSIDDSQAKSDWGWQEKFALEAMVKEMLTHVDISKIN
ncbi:MAG: NAD-dependent epimerase/dehydratase family protein [Bacteroidota bacterium]